MPALRLAVVSPLLLRSMIVVLAQQLAGEQSTVAPTEQHLGLLLQPAAAQPKSRKKTAVAARIQDAKDYEACGGLAVAKCMCACLMQIISA